MIWPLDLIFRSRAPVPADFQLALDREILRTERQRILELLAAVVGLAAVSAVIILTLPPLTYQHVAGRTNFANVGAIIAIFALFEIGIVLAISRAIAAGSDIKPWRRYLGALIETSLPTVLLINQINDVGLRESFNSSIPQFYFIFIILSTLRLDFWLSAFTGFVAAAQLFALAVVFEPHGGELETAMASLADVVRSVVLLFSGVVAGAVARRIRRQFETSIAAATARDRVTNLFGQQVSPQIVEYLLASDDPRSSEKVELAIMFVDIRGFTSASHSRTPDQIVERLNEAFAALVNVVDRNGGIVVKFLGDGFLAVFGVPQLDAETAFRSVCAGHEMLDAMTRQNEGHAWPLRIGIGLHIGEVIAGNIGSADRKEFTVIGDSVNFASRLEALNKDFGSQFLVSTVVCATVGEGRINAISLGFRQIRGYAEPIEIWRLDRPQ